MVGRPTDFRTGILRAWRPDEPDVVVLRGPRVDERYFETVNIPLLCGRAFTAEDNAGAEPVAIVSKPGAERLFGASDPIGARLTLEIEQNRPQVFTIVGVTGDFVGRSLDSPREQVLLPLAQHPVSRVYLVARGTPGTPPPTLTSAFQNAVRDLDPDITPASLITGDELTQRGMDDVLVPSVMVGGGGGAVLTLAALGIYGVIGFMVATRTREIAVRVALGASRRRVLGTIQSDVVKLVIPGVAVGLLLAVVLVRFVVPWRGLSAASMEPVIYAIAAAAAVCVALLAGLLPARRAASVEPMVAMRTE